MLPVLHARRVLKLKRSDVKMEIDTYCFFPWDEKPLPDEIDIFSSDDVEPGCIVHIPVFNIRCWGGDTGYCPHCERMGKGGLNSADFGFELWHPDGTVYEICEDYAAILMCRGVTIVWGYMWIFQR
jgi:hypothetical protein